MADLSFNAYQKWKNEPGTGRDLSFDDWVAAMGGPADGKAVQVNYTPTTPAEIADSNAYDHTQMLKKRITGAFADRPPSTTDDDTGRAWWDAQQKLSGKTDDQLQAIWRNRALQRASALPEDVADIALRDAQTGLVTSARRGSRRESMMFGDFNAQPPMGASSLMGG